MEHVRYYRQYSWKANLSVLVVVAPICEEVFVRGLLLRRWTVKWSARRGIVMSSVVFALLHVDVLGLLSSVISCRRSISALNRSSSR